MLSSLLTQLQTLISRRFIVSNFFPMLVFFMMNAAMLYWLNVRCREFAVRIVAEASATRSIFLIGTGLIGMAILAYIFGALLPALQLLLEGRWPAWLIKFFVPVQVKRLEALEEQMRRNWVRLVALQEPVNDMPRTQAWKDQLTKARSAGTEKSPGQNTFNRNSPGRIAVHKLQRLRRTNKPIDAAALDEAVRILANDLERSDANTKGDGSLELTKDRLGRLIDYALEHAKSEDIRLWNELRFNFGLQRPAPTLMGNIANTVQSYAERCYNLNLEVFWSRFQRSVQKDKDFGPMVEQGKTQLEFLISCSCLTAIWSVTWAPTLVVIHAGRLPFFITGVLGPLVAYIWYRVAVAHYRVFADILRASVDLFRFDVLGELHLPLPKHIPEEREIWEMLHRVHTFYETQGLRYHHPESK